MSTTYERIRTAVHRINRRDDWPTLSDIAQDLRSRKLEAFRIRDDGSSVDHYMKTSSIVRLLRLMEDLDLLEKGSELKFTLSEAGRRCVHSDEAFQNQIRFSVLSYLESHDLPMETIIETIEQIELPDVPDVDTIHSRLPDNEVSIDMLRILLFLLANAGAIDRTTRVFYYEQV